MTRSVPPSPAAPDDPAVTAAKQQLRRRLLDARRRRTPAQRTAAGRANAAHLLAAAAAGTTVCGFLPLPSEPLDVRLLDTLTDAGVRVLVPVVTGAAPLDWSDWSAARRAAGPGELSRRDGPAGIAELDAPRLGAAAIATADLVLVPALAVDAAGHRLGRGGGHYDRTLALLATLTVRRPPLVAVLDDDEVLDTVPSDALDVPVTRLVTPRGGLRGPGASTGA